MHNNTVNSTRQENKKSRRKDIIYIYTTVLRRKAEGKTPYSDYKVYTLL